MQRKANKIWMCRGRAVRLRGPEVMAIVNVTPDSFFAGSRAASAEDAAADSAAKGSEITFPVPELVREGDKFYILSERNAEE